MLVGAITRAGAGYTVTVRVIDPIPGQELAQASEEVSNKTDVLEAIGDVSAAIRTALGDATPQTAMAAAAETFTTTSLEAARDYAEAQNLANANRDEEAIAVYQRALGHDDRMGRAYAGWAASAFKLGRRAEAEDTYKKAFALVDRMTEREKFRTFGTYYLNIAGDYQRAIENYESLVAKYPADGAAHNNLALAYFNEHQFDKALAQGRHVLDIYPQSPLYRYNYALYAMYAGDFSTAATEARAALEQNANLPKAHLAIAMAALSSGNAAEARAAYERARGAGPRGVSLAAMGLADLSMYEGRFEDATAQLEAGLAADEEGQNVAAAAAKAIALAEAQQARGNTSAAAQAIERARRLSDQPAVLVPAATLLLASGRAADAARIADHLDSALAPRPRAFARLLRAQAHLEQGRPRDALDLLQQAQALADLWLVRYYKGIAYVGLEAYAQAVSELDLCVTRAGEATAVFLDDVPTFRYMAPLNYWLGRAHDGLGARDAAARHYRAYLALRSPKADALGRDAAARVAR